LKVIKPRGKIV